MKTLLYLTDLYYEAKGRKYYEEDLYITSKLKTDFNILIGHPQQALSNLESADLVVFRNTGSILGYQEYFQQFLTAVKQKNILTFNSFDGKADIKGKQYLIDLTILDFPVIPTIENTAEIDKIGNHEQYIVKLKNGADSIGMEILTNEALMNSNPKGKLIQPLIDFEYEVSFYYLNDQFQYALYAPDKNKRWELVEYEPTENDLEFAKKFIEWNNIERGITRVDACRLKNNTLLLVELEDLNPFLSIDLLSDEKRNRFNNNLTEVLKNTISQT
ncbi:hypothetical protein NAL32_02770 [Chryseobacterium sp. Ch-15]|uniref:ATP-grasp domain-containing protein n=1 Tax=Chryseobacterium muglaense TaxID=2893752 RepID=A0A9Q3UXE2_9FLAO|nr:hypothetical protein [Chryseobacterium muglaense]MBD3903287.1 hypothetical protein [Chryseobacterium muglaense]MCC9036117.1 hypothetical protein [Chryseobacterium muglaense]MCM2553307.1 hypothetical protein [Chryseobacterium muglaense]